MDDPSLNFFDLSVLIIVGLSALVSFFRGFVREMMSLGAWIVASVVTLRLLEPASHYIKPQVKSDVLATGIAAVGLFFITLVIISIATGLFMKFLKPGEKVGLLDNLVGLAFGVGRGILIVAICYFVLSTIFFDAKNLPSWLKKSYTRPYVEHATNWLGQLAPEYFHTPVKKDGKDPKPDDKAMKDLIKKLDHARDKTVDKVKDAADDVEEKAAELPSIQDLQKRIREENEKRESDDVR